MIMILVIVLFGLLKGNIIGSEWRVFSMNSIEFINLIVYCLFIIIYCLIPSSYGGCFKSAIGRKRMYLLILVFS